MDSRLNQLARELTEAISAAVADDARVEACREKARAAGFDMRVTLEAVIGFVDKDAAPQKNSRKSARGSSLEMSANDGDDTTWDYFGLDDLTFFPGLG